MPTEELEQALLAAKWGSAEEDATDVIAKLLGLDREAVTRVWFSIVEMAKMRLGAGPPGDNEIPDDVQTAMKAQLRRGLLRTLVRKAILNESYMYAHPRALITKVGDICRGCEFSIHCVVKGYSTPDKCFKGGPPVSIKEEEGRLPHLMHYSRGGAMVSPTRIRGDRVSVTCLHPRGVYDLDVGELWT